MPQDQIFSLYELEQAFLSVLYICGYMSTEAVSTFVWRYAASRGKILKHNYTQKKFIPMLLSQNRIFYAGKYNREDYYTSNPILNIENSQPARDAMWVYLEYLDGEDASDIVASTIQGPDPSQITFLAGGRTYHVCRVRSDGNVEIRKIAAVEESRSRALKARLGLDPRSARNMSAAARKAARQQQTLIEKMEPDRYIMVFGSERDTVRCPWSLLANPVMFCVIEYPDKPGRPYLTWINPAGDDDDDSEEEG